MGARRSGVEPHDLRHAAGTTRTGGVPPTRPSRTRSTCSPTSCATADRVLEVGVGTGVLALPLADAGIRRSTESILRSDAATSRCTKARAHELPFPLVAGRATRTAVPLATRSDGRVSPSGVPVDAPRGGTPSPRSSVPSGRVACSWRAHRELRRSYRSRIRGRFRSRLSGLSIEPRGLAYDGYDELDTVAVALGVGTSRPPSDPRDRALKAWIRFIDGIENNAYYSWTWPRSNPTSLREPRSYSFGGAARGPLRAARACSRTTSTRPSGVPYDLPEADERFGLVRPSGRSVRRNAPLDPRGEPRHRGSPPVRAPWAPAMSRDRRRNGLDRASAPRCGCRDRRARPFRGDVAQAGRRSQVGVRRSRSSAPTRRGCRSAMRSSVERSPATCCT